MALRIRRATGRDIPAITAIYAPYVLNTAVSFETDPPDEAEMARRMVEREGKLPYLVAEREGNVVGYAYASRFAQRAGYDWAADASVYVHSGQQHGGVGQALYRALVALLTAQGYRVLFGVLASPNPQSERFHERFGFRREGLLTHVGYKFGQPKGVSYYALDLHPPMENPPRPRPLSDLSDGEIETILDACSRQ